MNIEDIKTILPHRYPFLLVDRVDWIKDDEISATKNISANEAFFQGHFPERNVMPGVLLIETMAQAGAILILSKVEFKDKVTYLTDVNNAKFRKMVVPGDTLKVFVKIVKAKRNIIKCTGVLSINEKICASATFNCIVQ